LLNPKPAADPVPSEPAFTGPQRIGQIAVPGVDLDRAVAFYGEVLGLRFRFRAPPRLAFLDCGGVRLMLSRDSEGNLLGLMSEVPLP
jgi:catechol 2,3-dioxygenase-like lactoylglutathione lyase family enzyme